MISAVGTRGDLLDQHAVLLTRRHFEADFGEEVLRREVEPLEIGLDVGRQFLHPVVEARNGDAAIVVVHGGQDARKHAQRILRRAPEQAGMEIPVGAGEPDLLVDEPAQRRRHHGRRRIPHAGIADQREVELELVGIVLDEAEQVVRAAFLLALDHHGDGERQLAGDGLERTARLDEGHHLAFVVAGPARHDDLAAVGQRRDARRKWRRFPKVEWIDRLHVVMAVEEDARGLAVGLRTALAHHDRMPSGGPDAGLKTNAGQILGHVFGGRLTLVFVGRIGRDRLDAQEFEQPLEALIEIGVDFLQHGGKGMRGVMGLLLCLGCPGCHHPRNVLPAEAGRVTGIVNG